MRTSFPGIRLGLGDRIPPFGRAARSFIARRSRGSARLGQRNLDEMTEEALRAAPGDQILREAQAHRARLRAPRP